MAGRTSDWYAHILTNTITTTTRVKIEASFPHQDTLTNTSPPPPPGLSLNLLILHALAHIFFPRLRTRTRAFFRLSYYDTDASAYRRGPDDLYFVAYWTVIFTGLRAGVMAYVLLPWAQRAGLRTNKAKTRFAEQAWLLIYDSCSSGLGLVS